MGNSIKRGSKSIICLVNDIIIAFFGFPIAWKKFEHEIITPFINVKNRNMCIYFTANSIYSAFPLPNNDII